MCPENDLTAVRCPGNAPTDDILARGQTPSFAALERLDPDIVVSPDGLDPSDKCQLPTVGRELGTEVAPDALRGEGEILPLQSLERDRHNASRLVLGTLLGEGEPATVGRPGQGGNTRNHTGQIYQFPFPTTEGGHHVDRTVSRQQKSDTLGVRSKRHFRV